MNENWMIDGLHPTVQAYKRQIAGVISRQLKVRILLTPFPKLRG